jgi:Cyclin, N-terminal domain
MLHLQPLHIPPNPHLQIYHHPTPPSSPQNIDPPTYTLPPESDPFYGHEDTACLCARFITHLFACLDYPPSSTHSQVKLPYFIAYALHRTQLHSSVILATLFFLQRLRERFLTASGFSGHHLFISALMVTVKITSGHTYSNRSWSIVAQDMFTPQEIKQMEREMYSYLEPDLTIDIDILADFEKMVKQKFGSTSPYPITSISPVPSSSRGHPFPSTFAPAYPRRPIVTSPICIHCELDKGKERCGSLLGPASITFNYDSRSVGHQTIASESLFNHIGRDQHNHDIRGDQYNVVINPTLLNIVHPSESSYNLLGNTGLSVCDPPPILVRCSHAN